MTCDEVRRTIDLYLDGEFGSQEKANIEHHLAECSACRAFAFRQYQVKQGVRAAFSNIETPFRLKLSVQDGISRQTTRGMIRLGMSLAAVFVIAGLMLWLLLQPAATTPDTPQIAQTRIPAEVQRIRPPSSPGAGHRLILRPASPAFEPVNYSLTP